MKEDHNITTNACISLTSIQHGFNDFNNSNCLRAFGWKKGEVPRTMIQLYNGWQLQAKTLKHQTRRRIEQNSRSPKNDFKLKMMKIQIAAVLVGVLAVVMVTAKDEGCEDARDEKYCDQFNKNGYCQRYQNWAYERCASTCDICAGPKCEDKEGEEYCTSKKIFCKRFSSMRERLCRKTCGTCTVKG
ncbi:uncharacterized protein LOC116295931 [Actinia tenebrosa]|uniref:Uncharacterized protein LOC116295931 n=1 Tax=Actinia tenebrosa TaxID=6105 RepID=A0A6P8HWK8_ACTTE|nr:uncharacterized protein LOC116295931 [Actinia tenebrosa]